MMDNVLGMINLMNEQSELSTLTRNRCVAAVPFGGQYRLIDFALSNMSNSGIQKVFVLASPKSDSLLAHVGDGGHWGLTGAEGGVSVLAPEPARIVRQGDLDHFYSHLERLKSCTEKYVLLAPSHVIYRMIFGKMLDYHRSSGADITLLYQHVAAINHHAHIGQAIDLEMNDQGRVISFANVYHELPTLAPHHIDLETMIMSRKLLIYLIEQSVEHGYHGYLKDVIYTHLADLHVQGYANHGYVAIIDSIDSYYAHSMRLLQPQGWKQIMLNLESVYTCREDEPEIACHDTSLIRNSFLGPGCRIEGYVENSILFPGVTVSRGASVKNSVIMHDCAIAPSVYVDYAILDKHVVVEQGAVLCGEPVHPFVAEKNGIVVE